MKNRLSILGIRGIPASHGGFETFAERLALYLVERGWKVTVYCQEDGVGEVYRSTWKKIDLVHIPIRARGAFGTVLFDWKSVWMSARHSGGGTVLTLGYNTAVFNFIYRLLGIPNVINVDGIEWKRKKWGVLAKAWFFVNERCAWRAGIRLVADHPGIAARIRGSAKSKTVMIPYGGDQINGADEAPLQELQLAPGKYSVVIARPEPENSLLELVRSFSVKTRSHKLVVLGKFDVDANAYHKAVVEAASAEVIFLGAIYDARVVGALRFYSRFYCHGHQVGGTNPSLVEALGAGCAVLAHDNEFNRWVAGASALYFRDELECADLWDHALLPSFSTNDLKEASRARSRGQFTWPAVLQAYEKMLSECPV